MPVPHYVEPLLDFIGFTEAPKGYGTVYGNNQVKLPRSILSMTLDEVIAAGPSWTRAHGSSAAGRYQFMHATLKGLKDSLNLSGTEKFDAAFQDELAYALLKRRGIEGFVEGKLTVAQFGNNLAKEWASFPVHSRVKGQHRMVSRGETFYAGDSLNKVLTTPEAVANVLSEVLEKSHAGPIIPPPDNSVGWAIIGALVLAAVAYFLAGAL